jgi:dTDP-4-dehydrorhamnose reductase
MLLLLGASGYVGHAFATELLRRRQPFIPLTRNAIDYTNFNLLFDYIRKIRPEFLINAAGFTGKPDEDACEFAREETLAGNTLLPQTIGRACLMTNTPWGHVSSGHIYTGAKIVHNGEVRIERDLHLPEVRRLLTDHPEQIFGFTEADEPNCSFRCTPCSFYSGSKALAEAAIRQMGQCYIWRPGIPFNEHDEARNFLHKVQRSVKICDSINSLSHVEDFVRACLSLREKHAPFGTYNVVNPGFVTTRRVVRMIQRILKPDQRFEFWNDGLEWGMSAARFTHAHSILDTTKLRRAGVEMRPVEDALDDALRNWLPAAAPEKLVFH